MIGHQIIPFPCLVGQKFISQVTEEALKVLIGIHRISFRELLAISWS